MKRRILFALLLLSMAVSALAERISQAEWFIGSDPGVGNANAITVGTPGNQVSLNFAAPTNGLAPGLYRVMVRCKTDTTLRWGVPSPSFFLIPPAAQMGQLCTQFEWSVDGGASTVVDVADGNPISLNQIVATAGLSQGLHRFQVRTYDGSGRRSVFSDQVFVVTTASSIPIVHQVTSMDYWVDSDPPTTIDVPDGSTAAFAQSIASNNLSIGLHRINIRAYDETGRGSAATGGFVLVTSPFGQALPHSLTAAEYYLNADPGPGNGIPIPLPNDNAWGGPQEAVSTTLTGLPIGLHVIGFRVRDDAGRWSHAATDSIIVGPLLVIQNSGNDIVLNWQSGTEGLSQFKIYRATAANGTYALIDSTTAQTYTDPGVINAFDREFYRVTYQTTAVSNFRLPKPDQSDTPQR
jgi:hypothetical protein